MTLTNKEIELVFLGSSIAAGCKHCTSYHSNKANEAGATIEEIKNIIEISIDIREKSKMEMENYAMNLLGLYKQPDMSKENTNLDKTRISVCIGAAFAVNSVSILNSNIELGKSIGLSNDDFNKIFRAARLVKMKAASYADKISSRFENIKLDEMNNEPISRCC